MAKRQKSSTIHAKARQLYRMGKEFKLIRINNSFRLESDYHGNLSSSKSSKLPPKELGFVKRVRNHVLKEKVYQNFITNWYYPSDIDYVAIKKQKSGTVIRDLVEIDIDEAYWATAKNLNVLSEKLYHEGSKQTGKISKLGRLVALGSLAKKEIHYTFNGRQLIKQEIVRSKRTENIWYSICKRLSDVMYEAQKMAGSDFVMYWVDGIYIKNKPEVIKSISDLFISFGYDVKIRENLEVKYDDQRVYVTDLETNKTRPFYIPKKSKRRNYFMDFELREVASKYEKYEDLDDMEKDLLDEKE
jgi:hypothetical protein